jgi:non-specific serine/threonine protein kinase
VYIPITNSLGALGKEEAQNNWRQRETACLEHHLHLVAEDARARVILANCYVHMNRLDDAVRETNLAITLRPNEANVLYNAACAFCNMQRKPEALDALRKAWDAGWKDANWIRRDPDLDLLHGDPEFERMYPESVVGSQGAEHRA